MKLMLAGLIGSTGIVCILSKRSFLGFLMGVHLLSLGGALMFVLAGYSMDPGRVVYPVINAQSQGFDSARLNGHLVGFFLTFFGVAQLVAGFAVAIKLFYERKNANLENLNSLQQ